MNKSVVFHWIFTPFQKFGKFSQLRGGDFLVRPKGRPRKVSKKEFNAKNNLNRPNLVHWFF
ncbi:hypothetical protein MNB_SUP05-9-88 [hydrothermal vent metagenome]|uniref:Uncharacterized protein n=1 Tax=hydrothermal vent metagenome TaxID=652676 RepID=A0A1W1DSM3_9ZZZZ